MMMMLVKGAWVVVNEVDRVEEKVNTDASLLIVYSKRSNGDNITEISTSSFVLK